VWHERASEFSQNRLSGELPRSLEAANFPTQIPRRSFGDQSIGLIRGWLELQGGYAPCKISSQQPLRVQLGEAEVLHSTVAKPFFRAHRDRRSFVEERACAYSVVRFFLMIPAGHPQATIEELLHRRDHYIIPNLCVRVCPLLSNPHSLLESDPIR